MGQRMVISGAGRNNGRYPDELPVCLELPWVEVLHSKVSTPVPIYDIEVDEVDGFALDILMATRTETTTNNNAITGPLLACVTCSKSAFDAMCNVHSPDGSKAGFFLAKTQDPNSEQGKAYRMWTRQVFMPLNERVARLIVDRSDLIVGDKFEPLLLQLVAHVSAMRVMVKRWDEGDLTAITSIGYPDEIHDWIEQAFATLKATQAKFLALSDEASTKTTNKSTLRNIGETLDRKVTTLLYNTSKL